MSISERKEREKLQKRQTILESSIKLFKERGFLNVTIQDIARYSEISPGSVYLHYKSKDDIFAAIADLGTIKADKLVEEYFGRKEPITIDETKEFIKEFIETYREYGVYFDVLLLNYKGRKSFPELSEENVSRLKEGAITTLMRIVHYLTTTYKRESNSALKADIMLSWATLLGTSQLLDAVGRKELLNESEVEEVLHHCAE
jgi:AcrR family transcriptional regulator